MDTVDRNDKSGASQVIQCTLQWQIMTTDGKERDRTTGGQFKAGVCSELSGYRQESWSGPAINQLHLRWQLLADASYIVRWPIKV
jgi:hypothetical protein